MGRDSVYVRPDLLDLLLLFQAVQLLEEPRHRLRSSAAGGGKLRGDGVQEEARLRGVRLLIQEVLQ